MVGLAVLFVGSLTVCSAIPIVTTLPDYNGAFNNAGFPFNLGTVATFTYSIPLGASITSATFSGTYGTQVHPATTAPYNAVIGGQTIIVCAVDSFDCVIDAGVSFRPFSFNLASSTFGTLATGSVGLQLIQTVSGTIRLGSPTLTVNYTQTTGIPEPSSAALAGLGLLAFALRRRARSSSSKIGTRHSNTNSVGPKTMY